MEQTAKQKQKMSFGAYFDKNYAYFFAPIIAFVAYMVALLAYGVFPFGSQYTIASYDLSAQICPFIEHLFAVLKGEASLFYSHAVAGGADLTGSFLYFLISPFSPLFLILGEGKVAEACSIVLGLKIATIAFAGTWFSKKLFKAIPDYLCVAVGVVYAYCGYAFVSCTYINWLDFLIWLPFCTGAFAYMRRTGKILPFILFVTACVYTCFSIACFSMLVAFPVLIGYGVLCVPKAERNAFLTNLCLAFFTAVLLALPVLLPALSAYLHSARGGGLFDEIWYGFTIGDNGKPTAEFNKESFLERFGDSLYCKFSYILSDSVFLLLTLVYFARKGWKDPFAKFMLFAGAVTLTPVLVDESMLLLNMGSYMSYALRFGFLNALYFLGGACLALDGLCYRFDRTFDNQPLKGAKLLMQTQKVGGRVEDKRKNGFIFNTATVVFIVLTTVVVGFLIWYISGDNYKNMWLPLFADDSNMQSAIKSVSSKYAHSLGGAEMTAMLLGFVAIVAFTGFALVARRKTGVQTVALALMVVVGIQTVFYSNQMVVGNRSTQHKDLASYRQICQTLGDDEFFRVKDYGDKFTSNAPFTGGGNSFSVFSSVIDEKNFVIYNLFGYDGNGKNSLKSSHSDKKYNKSEVFGDSFLGYKYFIVPSDKKNEVASLGYMSPYIPEGGTEQLQVGDFWVFENTIVFPFAYKVQSGAFRFLSPNESNSTYRRQNQEALYQFLRGKTLAEMQSQTGSSSADKVTEVTARELSEYLHTKSAETTVRKDGVTARVTAEKGEYLLLPFVAIEGYRVRVNGKETALCDNDLGFLCVALDEGENLVEFTYQSPYEKDIWIGLAVAIVSVALLALLRKKTRFFDTLSPVVAWSGITLATAVLVFFMLFPSVVWVVKLLCLL